MINLIFFERDSIQWKEMWSKLSKHPINKGIKNPKAAINESEVWEYMGSISEGENIFHEFRHRCHPRYNQREYIRIQSTI